jgi:hypothetical protein
MRVVFIALSVRGAMGSTLEGKILKWQPRH